MGFTRSQSKGYQKESRLSVFKVGDKVSVQMATHVWMPGVIESVDQSNEFHLYMVTVVGYPASLARTVRELKPRQEMG